MSVITSKTRLSSILKSYSPAEREKTKNAIVNKVRFELPKELGVSGAIEAINNSGNYLIYNEFISFLRESTLNDEDFLRIVSEARSSIHLLTPNLSSLVEAILSLDWMDRSEIIIKEYSEFYIDLIVAHTRYSNIGIMKLISKWIPNDKDSDTWPNGTPNQLHQRRLATVHDILLRLLNVVPMTYDVVVEAVENQFPYYKKSPHVVAGFIHNILWLLEYRPMFSSHMITLIFRKILVIDVNASRSEIEEAEYESESMSDEPMFEIDDDRPKDLANTMNHPIAEILDICMGKMFEFIKKVTAQNADSKMMNFKSHCSDVKFWFKVFLNSFDNVILPSHNTDHIQFLLFHFCSLKPYFVEDFVTYLWDKVVNLNNSSPIRQSATGYLASFLARSKYVPLNTVKKYLEEMCLWAHKYIQRSDSVRSNSSLKANKIFFSTCQAIFYIIAFRSRDLTKDKKSLLFLQSLQLSSLVTSNFNPLRVCLPAVATAFAGVTRTYQLAYCHTILERNARRKLATVYANETSMPEECLETFFPFDPYLLKKSGKEITPIYLQYQASEAEEDCSPIEQNGRRKRIDDSDATDDIDDFIIDKRQKTSDHARSQDREMQFTYGLSPGFHI